jgi:hypothetical protein
MLHPFITKRHELEQKKECLEICRDIKTLLEMSPGDQAKIIGRRDEEIKDEGVRKTVRRRAACLGLLPEKLNRSEDSHCMTDEESRAWSSFLMGKKTSTTTLRSRLDNLETELRQRIEHLTTFEDDSGSSSYSDYSDSRTVSTDDGSGEEESETGGSETAGSESEGETDGNESGSGTGESESGEESEEEKTPPKRRRMRR